VCAELTDASLCYMRGAFAHQMSEGSKKRQHPRLDQAPSDRVDIRDVPGVHWSCQRNRFAARFYDEASSKYSYHSAKTLDDARQFSRTGVKPGGEVEGDDLIGSESDLETDGEKEEVEGDGDNDEIDLQGEIDAMFEGEGEIDAMIEGDGLNHRGPQ
jgi:hypothetical protein